MGNIVQLAALSYMVIDLESAALITDEPLPHDFQNVLRTCSPDILENGVFTPLSDMCLIGLLLEDALLLPSASAAKFIQRLARKELSADQALHWLQTRWKPP